MSEQRTSIRIMVVDDHPIVREGFGTMISTESDMALVAEARDGDEAVRLFRQHRPDVTLMELRMPGLNGVETIRAIRSEFPQSRFIVLTTYDGDEDIYRALEAGAQAYGQGARHEHPGQARRERPHPGRDRRAQARHR